MLFLTSQVMHLRGWNASPNFIVTLHCRTSCCSTMCPGVYDAWNWKTSLASSFALFNMLLSIRASQYLRTTNQALFLKAKCSRDQRKCPGYFCCVRHLPTHLLIFSTNCARVSPISKEDSDNLSDLPFYKIKLLHHLRLARNISGALERCNLNGVADDVVLFLRIEIRHSILEMEGRASCYTQNGGSEVCLCNDHRLVF